MATRMKGLGRGLNALFDSPASSEGTAAGTSANTSASSDTPGTLKIDQFYTEVLALNILMALLWVHICMLRMVVNQMH